MKTLETFYKIGVRIIEAYGQSESDTIAINDHKKFKIGSVGKPKVDIILDKNSEILIEYDEKRHGKNKSTLLIDNQGYIHTGDLGFIDNEGYLYLKGRIDDIIVLENGKKIHPFEIEKTLKNYEEVKDVVIFLNEKIISAIILTDKLSEVKIFNIIKDVNSSLSFYQRIGQYFIINEPFTVENGFLTSNLKLIRKAIIAQYKNESFRQIN